MIRRIPIVFGLAVLLTSSGLAGCATKQGTGAVLGAGTGAAAGAAIAKNNAIGAVVGGLVGGLIGSEIGRRMDQNDQNRLAQTFETNPTGRSAEWTNPDTGYRYSATPTETYQSENRPCRRFTLDADVEGSTNEQTVTGTACRRSVPGSPSTASVRRG